MGWIYKIPKFNEEDHICIYDSELKENIAIVDNLDKQFVLKIIDSHNKAIGLSFRNGIDEAKEIAKQVYLKKNKNSNIKKFRIIEEGDNHNSAHYIDCKECEQISPFSVIIDATSTVTFMNVIISIEEN